jgi:molecular chaperone GrpE
MSENTNTETTAPDAPEAPQTPEERLAAAEAEIAQLRDRWLRAEAEMQNLRARARREGRGRAQLRCPEIRP